MAEGPVRRLVWDLPTRLFHWLFASSILLSWLTAELGISWMKWHLRLGYFAIGSLLFRLAWGFIGPRHARFASFVRGPAAIRRYLRQPRTAPAPPGHNPLGALMVLLMLALGIAQTGTGLFATDDIAWAGPYNPSVTGQTASLLTRVHHVNFYVLLTAIGIHLLAIAYYWRIRGHNLVGPMLHGWKSAPAVSETDAIASSAWLRAACLALLCVAAVAALLWAAPAPVSIDPY